jgi:Tfp pilus assembly protein FimT
MAASLPNFTRLHQEWALWGGARLVESSLQWGRAHAVTANTSMVFIVADEGREFYWLDGYSGEKFVSSHCILPGQIRISASPRKPLRFYQHGNAVPAGTFVIEGQNGQYRVIVNAGGRIRVQRN